MGEALSTSYDEIAERYEADRGRHDNSRVLGLLAGPPQLPALKGLLLVLGGAGEWEGIDDYYGVPMTWSQHSPAENSRLVQQAGFSVVVDELDTAGGETHQLLRARATG